MLSLLIKKIKNKKLENESLLGCLILQLLQYFFHFLVISYVLSKNSCCVTQKLLVDLSELKNQLYMVSLTLLNLFSSSAGI